MRWSSAVDTDGSLEVAIEVAAEKVFMGLGRQEPDLAIVFVSAHHAARFDAVASLVKREFENACVFGCCAGAVASTWIARSMPTSRARSQCCRCCRC